VNSAEIAEQLGEFREVLGAIAEHGPGVPAADQYRRIRSALITDDNLRLLLPEFVIECRTPRDFWNYIQQAFGSYTKRSRYIEAQMLPIERQFRPERQNAPGTRPLEIRIEYSPVRPVTSAGLTFVAETRLTELRTIGAASFDLRRLIRLCEELNVAYIEGCYHATAMLTRALLDHVPPVFGKRTFAEVASNYGSKSFKDSMRHLENGARKIGDAHLHTPIRSRETLPTAQQVAFGPQVDVLLEEIARILSSR
jgi:hypothetical protein